MRDSELFPTLLRKGKRNQNNFYNAAAVGRAEQGTAINLIKLF